MTTTKQEERTMRKEVSRFMIGGTYIDGAYTGPSIPDEIFQRALGTTIKLDIAKQEAIVPTDSGVKTARKGDTIVAYSDFSFDVEPGGMNHAKPVEEEHEEYYAIPEAIFGQHELTEEEKKQYVDYFSKVLKKR